MRGRALHEAISENVLPTVPHWNTTFLNPPPTQPRPPPLLYWNKKLRCFVRLVPPPPNKQHIIPKNCAITGTALPKSNPLSRRVPKLELIQLQNESLDRISHHISLEGNTSTEPLEKYLLEKNGKPINIMVIT